MTCPHPNPALCQLLRRHMVGRLWDIWTGTVLTPDQCQRYRELFCRTAGVEIEEAYAVAPWDMLPSASRPAVAEKADDPDSLPCIDRGPKIRDEVCKPCQNAGHSTIPVYQCHVFGECVIRGVVWTSVTGTATRMPTCLTCKVRKPPVAVTLPSKTEPVVPPAAPPQANTPRHPLPKHVTRWAVGITSAPRPVPTLGRCVASVIAAGFSPIVFAEPGTDVEGLPCPVVMRQTRLGIWRNYVQTLRDLLAAYPQAQALLVLQDDVVLCRDVREFLEHDLWPGQNPGMVSIYTPEEKEQDGNPGCDRRTGGVIGVCAVIYPRRVVEMLVSSPFAKDWRGRHDQGSFEPDPVKKKAIDTGICETLRNNGLGIYNYRPSLAQHIAETSAIGHGGRKQVRGSSGLLYRMSKHFVGEDRSAFDVFPAPWVRYNLPGAKQRYRESHGPERTVTVVIPGYGCEDLTVQCLNALNTHAFGVVSEIIYVDNGSPPDTVEVIERQVIRIPLRVIRNDSNRGFSVACNQGIAAANPDSHILLLNTDAFVGPECVQRLRWHADRHHQVAAVGPVTGDDGAQSLKRSDVSRVSRYSGDFARERYQIETAHKLRRQFAIPRDVLSGFCLLLTRPALDQFGPLRQDGALASGLGADDEWCLRAHRAGWLNLLVCNAWCVHLHRSTFKRWGIDRNGHQRAAVSQLQREGVL